MRFIRYARKSSEGNERQMQSIPDQNAALARLAVDQDLAVDYELEEAKSAKKPGIRPVFGQMIELLQAGGADAILCWNLSRLSRNPVDSGTLSWLLQEKVIKLIKTPFREYRPEDNALIMAVDTADANQFIRELKENVRRAQDEKAQRGWYPYRPRAGYLTNRETGEIELDPFRFPLMRRVWELMLSGAYTVPEALDELNLWGYRSMPKRGVLGGPMIRSHLYLLLSDPFYSGDFSYQGQVYQGKHQPMVTREEFDRVQRLIHRSNHIQPQKLTFPFTGLIRCGKCGCLVTAERKVKNYKTTGRTATYTYYHCTGSKGCPKNSISEAYIEDRIAGLIDACSLDSEAAAWAKAGILRDHDEEPDDASRLLANHKRDLALVTGKLTGLLDLRLGGELSPEEFQTLKLKYQHEADQLKLAIERLERWQQRREQSVGNLMDFATSAATLFATRGEKAKREVATVMAEGYLLTLGQLDVQLHPLLEPLVTFERPKTGGHQVQTGVQRRSRPSLCARLESNQRLLAPQASTLSAELRAHLFLAAGAKGMRLSAELRAQTHFSRDYYTGLCQWLRGRCRQARSAELRAPYFALIPSELRRASIF